MKPTANEEISPSWAPDGRSLVFDRRARGDDYDLLTVDVATGWTDVLLDDAHFSAFPAWSPNGSTIAFTSARGGRHDVWLIEADDPANLRNLTAELDATLIQYAAWSPDGSRLVFELETPWDGETVTYGLWSIEADGAEARPPWPAQRLPGSQRLPGDRSRGIEPRPIRKSAHFSSGYRYTRYFDVLTIHVADYQAHSLRGTAATFSAAVAVDPHRVQPGSVAVACRRRR